MSTPRVLLAGLAALLLGSSARAADPSPSASAAAPARAALVIPADGKYPNVKVEGITVPLIQIMEKGAIVLIDTDGKKPRSWEAQFKRKAPELPAGWFDLHKTDANKNGDFKDDEVDRQGIWKLDEKGNITQD